MKVAKNQNVTNHFDCCDDRQIAFRQLHQELIHIPVFIEQNHLGNQLIVAHDVTASRETGGKNDEYNNVFHEVRQDEAIHQPFHLGIKRLNS